MLIRIIFSNVLYFKGRPETDSVLEMISTNVLYFKGRPETDSVLEMISSTQTKIYYVPIGDDKNNSVSK